MSIKPKRAAALAPRVAALSIALLLGNCGVSDPIESNVSPGDNTGKSELSGTLVFKDGAPATGAWVRLYSAADMTLLMAKGSVSAAVTVDSVQVAADGDFDVTGLADGTYNLLATVQKNDTSFALYRSGISVNGKTGFGTDTLRATGVLTLQATAEEDLVQGATCQIDGTPWSAVTNAEGVCALSGLPPGTYEITVSHPSFETKASSSVEISAGGTFSAGELTLLPQAPPPPPSRHFKIFASTVALWTFNSQTSNRFEDEGPHSFTLSGSGGYSLVPSPFGSAVAFGGGTAGILQCAYDDLLAPIETGRLTIEARARLDAYPVNAGANTKGFIAGMLGGLNMEVTHDGRLQASYSREGAAASDPTLHTFRSDSMKVPLGSWTNLAVAMDGRPDTV